MCIGFGVGAVRGAAVLIVFRVHRRPSASSGCEGLQHVYGLPATAMDEASTTLPSQFPTLVLQIQHSQCSSSLPSLWHDITRHTITVQQPTVNNAFRAQTQ